MISRAEMIAMLRDVADNGVAKGFWRVRGDLRAIADGLEQEQREGHYVRCVHGSDCTITTCAAWQGKR